MRYPLCPNCYDGVCSACWGNGCYCDCQIPEEIRKLTAAELLAELADEDEFIMQGFA